VGLFAWNKLHSPLVRAANPTVKQHSTQAHTAVLDTRVQLVHSLNDQRAGGNKQRSAQRLDRKKEKDRTER
jgi:hypothetical protein